MPDTRACLNNTENETPKVPWTQKPLIRQVAVSSCVWVTFFQMGLFVGALPVLVAQLQRDPFTDATVIDDEKASWITSAGKFSAIPCVLLMGLMNEYFGRKFSHLFMNIISCASFVVFYLATSYNTLILAQVLQGPLHGGLVTVCLMIAAECISPKYRGVCLTIKTTSGFWAIWIANAVGTFFHWKNIGIIGVMCTTYNIFLIILCPESPYWLMRKGKTRKCREAHRWLRGTDESAEKDLECLIKYETERSRMIEKHDNLNQKLLIYFKKISATQFYRPVFLSLLLSLSYQFSGKLIINVYAINIIKKITDSETAAYMGMLTVDGITVLGMYVGCVVSRYTKRRTLFFSTEFVAIFFLFLISSYLYLIKIGLIEENVYLSVLLLLAFSLSITCGPIILSYSLASEIMPLELRTLAAILVCMETNIIVAVSFKFAPLIFSLFGTHGAFLFFAIGSLVCAIILFKYLPETKNKTLQEIEVIFMGKEKAKKINELIPMAVPLYAGTD